MKKRIERKKGFTLVELVVVLVILVILIAMLVPALTGYIRRAKEDAVMVDCRSAVVAAQTLYSEVYNTKDGSTITMEQIKELAEVPGTVQSTEFDENYKLLHLVYFNDPYTVTYCKNYETCPLHEKMYNLTEGSGTGEGGSGGGTQSPAGSVTLTDTQGNSHVLNPTLYWADVAGTQTSFGPGKIISDGTETYIYAHTQDGIQVPSGTSMEALITRYPSRFVKLDTQTIVLQDALKIGATIQQGTIGYDGSQYYVMTGTQHIKENWQTKFGADPWKPMVQ